ncbi:MAG TPA: hypothetical protein VK469_11115, partial [Candidatus Kapabacteria bacterium]|nr:hypothetical protein [Candidatus Kapabacteria bacterium]
EYYFVVNSWTNPHKKNQSKIQSENSAEVSSNIARKVVIISGKVEKRRKEGVNGVILTFNPPNKFTNTDNNGNYRHIVDSPWTGTLVPKKPGYEFKPEERELTNVTSNQPGINFDAIPIYKEISGKVSAARGGIDGVTLTFTSNNITETVNTNDKGEYSHKVPFGWIGIVTPTKKNLSFSPAYKEFSSVNEDKKNENYELNFSFTLTAIWKKDKALIMYKDYGEIESKIPEIEFSTKAIKEYILYRKEKEETGTFVEIVRFPAQEQKNFSYKDENLVNGKEYIYVAEEIDEQGKIIGQSDEVQLNWVSK